MDARGKAGRGGKGKDKKKDKGFGKKGGKEGKIAAEVGGIVSESEGVVGGSSAAAVAGGQPSDGASPSASSPLPALICQSSPISLAKAVKNEAEIAGMKAAHIR